MYNNNLPFVPNKNGFAGFHFVKSAGVVFPPEI